MAKKKEEPTAGGCLGNLLLAIPAILFTGVVSVLGIVYIWFLIKEGFKTLFN